LYCKYIPLLTEFDRMDFS